MNTSIDPVLAQAITLSSGTIAALTGISAYDKVEAIQNAFVTFVSENEGKYARWQDAWQDFARSRS